MDLKDYLSNLPRGTHGDFAAQIGIDKVYLSQIASRKQGGRSFVPSPALAVRIEQATQSQVTRRDLRPDDWQKIWPELVNILADKQQAVYLKPLATPEEKFKHLAESLSLQDRRQSNQPFEGQDRRLGAAGKVA